MTIGNDCNLLAMENNEGRNGRMLKVDLKTQEIAVLAEGLSDDRELIASTSGVVKPTSAIAQASGGAIYFTEPGAKSFGVLRPQ